MQYVRPFLRALLLHWWVLLSCALFTLLGIFVLGTGRSNLWAFWASLILAVCLLMVAAFFAWKDEYVPNREGPEVLLEWQSQEPRDMISIRNIGAIAAFNVAVLEFSWSALLWHRRIEFPSIDPQSSRTCEAQFAREVSPNHGEIGYLRHILRLSERPNPLLISVAFANIHGHRFQRAFTLELVQVGQNTEIACRPGRLEFHH